MKNTTNPLNIEITKKNVIRKWDLKTTIPLPAGIKNSSSSSNPMIETVGLIHSVKIVLKTR